MINIDDLIKLIYSYQLANRLFAYHIDDKVDFQVHMGFIVGNFRITNSVLEHVEYLKKGSMVTLDEQDDEILIETKLLIL